MLTASIPTLPFTEPVCVGVCVCVCVCLGVCLCVCECGGWGGVGGTVNSLSYPES